MGFVTPALLAGAALIAVPIVLHLIMRREVQRLRFPALRFVQQRRTLNQHRLKLRHLLLLVLRCAIIALLAFALARPMLQGAGGPAKEGAPVATALVFDDALRMGYEQLNQTRLEQAKKMARWLIMQLPADAPVTVVDRGGRQRGQEMDRDAADLRVERLELSAGVRSMEESLRDATRWLEGKRDYRGEIYVFTDMSTEAWTQQALADFAKSLDNLPGAKVYVIDVGALKPANLALGPLKLSSDELAPGSVLQLTTELQSMGGAGKETEAIVELYVGDGDAKPEKRGQQVVTLKGSIATSSEGPGNSPTPIEFSLSGLELGTHQGFVRIAGSDALPCDDVRYFTVTVRPPVRILLLAENDDAALFLREALQPTAAATAAPPRFHCEFKPLGELESSPLAEYAAVCLIDPPSLSNAGWRALADYGNAGGGIGIFLGRRARRDEMNSPDAQQLLPAKLRWQSREKTYLRPVAIEHPALRELAAVGDSAPWPEFPVFKHWELEAGAEPAHTVASYANGKPALVERQLGAGRVLMMTTPVSDSAHDDPWNLLPTAPDPWPFLALANGIAQYLVGGSNDHANYLAGQTVDLPLAPHEQVDSYVLQMPDGTAVRQSLAPGQQNLSIAATDALGNYRVRAGGKKEQLDRGFSVNLPGELTVLERTTPEQFTTALGENRVRVARTRDEIEIRVGQARLGRELFPLLIVAMALALAAEGLLANRFYGEGPSAFGSQLAANTHADAALSPRAHSPQPKADSRQPTAVL
jgi:hypothetical protein